jgi:hypothetical protein
MNSRTIEAAEALEAAAVALRNLAASKRDELRAAPPPPAAPATSPDAGRSYPQRPAPSHEVAVAPFGRAKGQPLDAVETKDLQWLADALGRSIDDPSKQMYRRKNEGDLANVQAELARRRAA